MRKLKRNMRAALAAALVLALTLLPVAAQGAIDTDRAVTLTVRYWHEKTPIEGAPVEIYRVADVSAYGEYTLCGDFAGYPVRVSDLDAEGWQTLAETLTGYVQRDKVKPLDSGKTDARGYLTFPKTQKSMTAGLYLVIVRQFIAGQLVYTTEPFLVALPNPDSAGNSWSYDVTVSPKHSRGYPSADDPTNPDGSTTTIDRKVLKVWDAPSGTTLPSKITVQLLKNGVVYDTVTLNKQNNWRHTWSKLPKYDASGRPIDWRLTESETKGYTVTVSQQGQTFVVTNTADRTDSPNKPDSPSSPSSPDSPSRPSGSGSQLPNTGVLWWPVPVMGTLGVVALVFGCLRGRKKRDD